MYAPHWTNKARAKPLHGTCEPQGVTDPQNASKHSHWSLNLHPAPRELEIPGAQLYSSTACDMLSTAFLAVGSRSKELGICRLNSERRRNELYTLEGTSLFDYPF